MLEDFFTLTEMKDGISSTARIGELVSEIQKLTDAVDFNTSDLIRQCSTAANTLASTKNEECLQHFVQLNGLDFLNQWLQEAQNCSMDISNSAEDLIDAILTALERLPVNNEQSTSCGLMPTIEQLLSRRNTKFNQKAGVLYQKWSTAPKYGTDGQQMDKKDACRADHLKPPSASRETENDKQDAATAEAKSGTEVMACSGFPFLDPSLTNENTDITKPPPVLRSPNSSDGNAILGDVSSSVSSFVSHGGLENVSITEEASISNIVGLGPNCMLQSNSLGAKCDAGHVAPVDVTLNTVYIEPNEPNISLVSRKMDVEDRNVSCCLDINKGESLTAGQLQFQKDTAGTSNHLTTESHGLQDSSEGSMGKKESPTSSSGMDGMGIDSEIRMTKSMEPFGFGDSSKAAEKVTAPTGEKSTPLTEYDDTDALEVARLVAIEVEREVIDYRGPFCSSPDINSGGTRHADGADLEVHQQPEPPIAEMNDNKSSGPGEGSRSSSLKDDGSGITDDSGPLSRKHAQDLELGMLDLNANQCTEEINFHPKPSTSIPVNLSTPIAVAASRGPSAFPHRLHFEGVLGWKGSAATSAFRLTSPQRTHEGGKSISASQKRSSVLFDLNIAESEDAASADPLSTAILTVSSDLASRGTSATVGVRTGERFKLDLNCPCDEDEAATTTAKAPFFWNRQQHNTDWKPSSCSYSTQPAVRNFDLNDNVSIFDGSSSQGMDESSVRTSRKDISDHSAVTILGTRITLGQKEYQHQNQHNFLGPSVESGISSRSMQSYVRTPPDYSVTSYPSQSAVMSFPLPFYAPGSVPYMVDAKGAPLVPPISGLSAGVSHPSSSRTISPSSSEFSYLHRSVDFNYGLSSEGVHREARTFWPVPFQGHTVFIDEYMRNMSQGGSSGVLLKRKEPDSGWDPYSHH